MTATRYMQIAATGNDPEDARQSLAVLVKALAIAHGGIEKGPTHTELLPTYAHGAFTHRAVCSVRVPLPVMAHLEVMAEAAGYQ